jgi:hypothetical protein
MNRFYYIIGLHLCLMIMLSFSVLGSDGKGYPQENVKLLGRYYTYPTGLEGSPYLQDEWQTGNIKLENGKTAVDIKIRFNLINNDLIFYNEALKKVFITDKETVNSFTINPGRIDSLFFIKYSGPDVEFKLKNNDFVHVLCQGKINFFVKHMADVIDANDVGSKDKVYPKNIYFLNFDNKTVDIKLRYWSIYNLFPSKRKEIKKVIIENKIRRVNENNIQHLFDLLNETQGF